MYTYQLIEGGYEIFVNSSKMIHQPHSPTRGVSVKLTEQEAEGIAKLICAKLEQGVDPTVLAEEEQEIRSEERRVGKECRSGGAADDEENRGNKWCVEEWTRVEG